MCRPVVLQKILERWALYRLIDAKVGLMAQPTKTIAYYGGTCFHDTDMDEAIRIWRSVGSVSGLHPNILHFSGAEAAFGISFS